MTRPDLNLLVTLDALLTEGNVARAARRLNLSPSAMSRALARLRKTTGDPLLVRAGRGLVPTPRALELREQVGQLVQDAQAVLRPVEGLDLKGLERTFTLRNREGFVENFGARLIARIERDAPGVRLRFVPKPDKDSQPLRDSSVDLETGVIGSGAVPELRVRALFREQFVGVVRQGHPLCKGEISATRYTAERHVLVARRSRHRGPIDDALETLGLQQDVATVVSGFPDALALVRDTDLVASVPERSTDHLRSGLFSFPLPFPVPQITISMIWHPRMEADPAHRWLRNCFYHVCSQASP